MSMKEQQIESDPVRNRKITNYVQQECVKENVTVKSIDDSTYADICKFGYNYPQNDTHHLLSTNDPGLLLKLRNVANQCLAKSINNTS